MKTTMLTVVAIILLAIALAGCGGGGMDATQSITTDTLSTLTAGLTALQTGDLLPAEAPVDVAEINTAGGDIPTTAYSEPQLWYGGRWTSLKPYIGKKRFIGPSGVYRFAPMPSTPTQTSTKGGIGRYSVVDQLPMPVAPQSEGRWQLWAGYFTIRGGGSTPFTLEVVSGSTGQPLMRCAVVNPDSGAEYPRGAYGRFLVEDNSRILLLPAWYNMAGKRVRPPTMPLTASGWGDSAQLTPIGNQMFVVTGYYGVFSAGLSVTPKWGSQSLYWYSPVRLNNTTNMQG